MTLRLRSLLAPEKSLSLDGAPIRLGRSPENDVVLADRYASRRHAEIRFEGGEAVLTDLGSKLGTLVNGQRLDGPHVLRPGDRIGFGSEAWEVGAAGVQAPAAQPAPRTVTPAAGAAPQAPAKPASAPGIRGRLRRFVVGLLAVAGVLLALLAAAGWAASDARRDALDANATLMALAQTSGVLRPERIAFLSEGGRSPRNVGLINVDGSGRSTLTNVSDRQGIFDAEYSPAAGRVAFTLSSDDGSPELFVIDADGSNVRQLTRSPDMEHHVAWSPDGRQLAFDAFAPSRGQAEIYRMNDDGSSLAQLTSGGVDSSMPAWSPDGGRIAYVCGEDLCLMNADGSGSRGLSLADQARPIAHPAWSPDGSRIAFTCALDICAVNADGSGYTRLTENTAPEWGPRWLASGQIVFSVEIGGNAQIHRMDADGGNVLTVAGTSQDEMTRLGR